MTFVCSQHVHARPRAQISLDRVLLRNTGPGKAPLQLGATACAVSPAPDLIVVGGGDGALCVMRTTAEPSPANPKRLKPMAIVASVRLEGGVSSVVLDGAPARGGGFSVLVGTKASNVYRVTYDAAARK